VKILYATKYLKLADRVTVHGFDTFEGMPASDDLRDKNIVENREEWVRGQYAGNYKHVMEERAQRYTNFRIHKGKFEEALHRISRKS